MSAVARLVIDAPHRSDVVASATATIGWRTDADTAGWLQASAVVELTRGDTVETHSVDGRASTGIPWPFAPLAPRVVVAGFLGDGEWRAVAIGLPDPS